MTAPGSFDAAITAALDAQTDVRDWARHRMAEGLGAALTVLAGTPQDPKSDGVDNTNARTPPPDRF